MAEPTDPAAVPSTIEELQQQIETLEALLSIERDTVQELRDDLQLLQGFATSIVRAIGERTQWELRNQEIAQKWRSKNEALTRELQLAQVGLTSGCGCPIGVCQKSARAVVEGSCWLQWAEAHILQRLGNIKIGDLQNAAYHPSRFAKARAEGKNAPRLATPEPDADGVIREPGIENFTPKP